MEKEKIIDAAAMAREKAYAPYSGFKVGAAVLTKNGNLYTGCNIENASYGETVCAERVAIFKAVSEEDPHIEVLVVYSSSDIPAAPCGACRQVLTEFSSDAEIIMANTDGEVRIASIKELFPLAFNREYLEGGKNIG